MGAKTRDLTEQSFGRLTVVAKADPFLRADGFLLPRWRCLCSCGATVDVSVYNLLNGNTQSCGCVQKEKISARNFRHGLRKRDEREATPEYDIWAAMKQRCENPNNEAFHNYGGRGIKVCDRWADFANFIADMGLRPSPDMTLERVNNDLGYSKSNCVWAPRKQQARNTRRNVFVTYQGRSMTLAEAAEVAGISVAVVHARRKYGWPEAMWFVPVGTIPSGPKRRATTQEASDGR